MSITNKIKEFTFEELCIRGRDKIIRESKGIYRRKRDTSQECRYLKNNKFIRENYIDLNILNLDELDDVILKELCKNYIEHEFDLLGSGLQKIEYNMECFGVEGVKYNRRINIEKFDKEHKWLNEIILKPHLKYSKYLLSNIDGEYTYIDWQLDFKSGYRYDSKRWYKDQKIGHLKGVDIKVPWELGRMQHLVQMAIGAIKFKDLKVKLLKEFKNQILDFIATNPVNMGCNWSCTMDVGIRVSNWLLAYDILSQIDSDNILDNEFLEILSKSVYDHGKFIINNLEWEHEIRANHYLANIAGLLFVSTYLESDSEIDSWFKFSVQELFNEMEYQFNVDGSNFEASTSYHRLSGEIIFVCTALIIGVLNSEKKKALQSNTKVRIKRLKESNYNQYSLDVERFFPMWYVDRLFKISKFTSDILKNNGNIPQIGDNDSGRFLKLTPIGEIEEFGIIKEKYENLTKYEGIKNKETYFDEEILNHESFISMGYAFFSSECLEKKTIKYPLEFTFIKSLSKNKNFIYENIKEIKEIKEISENKKKLQYSKEVTIRYKDYGLEKIDCNDIETYLYRDFGICVLKNKLLYISLFFGENGQKGNGGHAHNDKLSIEITINNIDICKDSGTYLYTSIPEKRNYYRSIQCHNVPNINNIEQNDFKGLFSMYNNTNCMLLGLSNNYIAVKLEYKDITIIREISIFEENLKIKDWCNQPFTQQFNLPELISNGYGKLLKSKNTIVIYSEKE